MTRTVRSRRITLKTIDGKIIIDIESAIYELQRKIACISILDMFVMGSSLHNTSLSPASYVLELGPWHAMEMSDED